MMALAAEPLLPGRWQRLLARWLAHRIDVVRRGGTDAFGEPTDGETLSQVPCFIDGSRSRIPSQGSQDQSIDFTVVFPREVEILVEDRLLNGRDRGSRTILTEGTVVRIDPTVHPDFGELVRTAMVVRA